MVVYYEGPLSPILNEYSLEMKRFQAKLYEKELLEGIDEEDSEEDSEEDDTPNASLSFNERRT